MKKLNVILVLIILSILLAATCYAANGSLASKRISIGGISCRSTGAQVQRIYGKPNNILNKSGLITHVYGNSFYVEYFINEDIPNSQIHDIRVTGKNGIATADGIKVGMPEMSIRKVYGTPVRIGNEDGRKYYLYVDRNNEAIAMGFWCKDGKIVEMYMHWAD